MSVLSAGDALYESVVRVPAEQCLADVGRRSGPGVIYAVFEDDDPGAAEPSGFLGIVTAGDIVPYPRRIFADLLPSPQPVAVAPERAIEDVLAEMHSERVNAKSVLAASGGFLGVVTRCSLLQAAFERAQVPRSWAPVRPPAGERFLEWTTVGVAHNLNNLLTVIFGNLAVAESQTTGEVKECILEATRAAHRATVMLGALAALGRPAADPTIVNVGRLVEEVAAAVRSVVDPATAIVVETENRPLRVSADSGSLYQVLLNLVMNARDALAVNTAGGTSQITLEATAVDVGPAHRLLHPPATFGPHVRIVVADSGVGMDAETLERIFDPFFTTKETVGGRGVGLATVRDAVNRLGGWITVESRPNEGSRFAVHLPLAAATDS